MVESGEPVASCLHGLGTLGLGTPTLLVAGLRQKRELKEFKRVQERLKEVERGERGERGDLAVGCALRAS